MGDLVVKYKDTNIIDLSATGTKVLQTKGNYCEDDITITYTRPGTATTTTQITPTEAIQTVAPAAGYVGFNQVTVAGITSTYVGSGITRRSAADLTTSGAVVTAPAGYYASGVSKSVSTTTHLSPTISVTFGQQYVITATHTQGTGYVNADTKTTSLAVPLVTHSQPSIILNTTTGLITANHILGAGMVSTDEAGTTTSTLQLLTQAATTITPTESMQTAVAANKYTTGAVTVAAISSNYVGSGITTRSSSDMSAAANVVTAPSGYYASAANYTVATVAQATPTITVGALTGLITATVTQDTGYVNAGTTSTTYQLTVRSNDDVTANDYIVGGPSGYYPNSFMTSVNTVTQVTPTITLNSSTGVLTATATQAKGWVSAGTKTTTYALLTKAAATYTPSTVAQTISSGVYLTDAQTIQGDAALIASNIKAGTSIFGVAGTFTSNATASSSDILVDKTAYVNGTELTGTMQNRGNLSWTATTSSSQYLGASGYYSGIYATVSATTTSITPTSTTQTITGANGAYLKSVTVGPASSATPSFQLFSLTITDSRTSPYLSASDAYADYTYDSSTNYVKMKGSSTIAIGSNYSYTWSGLVVPARGDIPTAYYKIPWVAFRIGYNAGKTTENFDVGTVSNCYATKYKNSTSADEWILLVAPTADGVAASVTLVDAVEPSPASGVSF